MKKFGLLPVSLLLTMIAATMIVPVLSKPSAAQTVVVDTSHAINTFSPLYALGTTVDRVPSNATDTFFSPDQLEQVLSPGWGVVSYLQNTDPFSHARHWNPKATWRGPSGKGYFSGTSTPTQ